MPRALRSQPGPHGLRAAVEPAPAVCELRPTAPHEPRHRLLNEELGYESMHGLPHIRGISAHATRTRPLLSHEPVQRPSARGCMCRVGACAHAHALGRTHAYAHGINGGVHLGEVGALARLPPPPSPALNGSRACRRARPHDPALVARHPTLLAEGGPTRGSYLGGKLYPTLAHARAPSDGKVSPSTQCRTTPRAP